MKLAIVGSRNFINYELFKKCVLKILEEWNIPIEYIDCIVSGGAKGTDSLAERFADENNISKRIFSPDWKKYGRGAGILRNTEIVENSTHCIAFPSRQGKGTQDTIKKFRISKGKDKIKILFID